MSDGLHKHHRRKGDRGTHDEGAAYVLMVDPEVHEWIEKHPEEARELGWSVSRYDDPEAIPVTIPKGILVKKAKAEKKEEGEPEAPRKREVVGIRVPKDELENGAETFQTLLEACREKLDLASGGKSGPYIVLVAVMHDWLTNS